MADTKKIIVVQLSSNISSSPSLILIKIRESQPLTPTALFLYHNFAIISIYFYPLCKI